MINMAMQMISATLQSCSPVHENTDSPQVLPQNPSWESAQPNNLQEPLANNSDRAVGVVCESGKFKIVEHEKVMCTIHGEEHDSREVVL